ncbi:hypothetical protein PSW65_23245, partial [Shigella flexneri]|nr:hypothetical protein [Shigella flexneri]
GGRIKEGRQPAPTRTTLNQKNPERTNSSQKAKLVGGHPENRSRRQTNKKKETNEKETSTEKHDALHHLSSKTARVESDVI